jgi:hypothetical protein
MELKTEQVEQLFQILAQQSNKNEKEISATKKWSVIIVSAINLLVFLATATIVISYGISSYNKTVETVKSFEKRMDNIQVKVDRIDSLAIIQTEQIRIVMKKLDLK